jgi:hypothetical protein
VCVPVGGGGGCYTLPSLPLAGSDIAFFSRSIYGKTETQRKDRQTDKRNDRTTKRQKGKGKGRQIEETEKQTDRNTER